MAQGERAGSRSEATTTEGRLCYLLSDFPLVHSFPSSMKQVNDTSASSGSIFKQEQCTGRCSIRSTCPSAQVQASSPDSQVHCPPTPSPAVRGKCSLLLETWLPEGTPEGALSHTAYHCFPFFSYIENGLLSTCLLVK